MRNRARAALLLTAAVLVTAATGVLLDHIPDGWLKLLLPGFCIAATGYLGDRFFTLVRSRRDHQETSMATPGTVRIKPLTRWVAALIGFTFFAIGLGMWFDLGGGAAMVLGVLLGVLAPIGGAAAMVGGLRMGVHLTADSLIHRPLLGRRETVRLDEIIEFHHVEGGTYLPARSPALVIEGEEHPLELQSLAYYPVPWRRDSRSVTKLKKELTSRAPRCVIR